MLNLYVVIYWKTVQHWELVQLADFDCLSCWLQLAMDLRLVSSQKKCWSSLGLSISLKLAKAFKIDVKKLKTLVFEQQAQVKEFLPYSEFDLKEVWAILLSSKTLLKSTLPIKSPADNPRDFLELQVVWKLYRIDTLQRHSWMSAGSTRVFERLLSKLCKIGPPPA